MRPERAGVALHAHRIRRLYLYVEVLVSKT